LNAGGHLATAVGILGRFVRSRTPTLRRGKHRGKKRKGKEEYGEGLRTFGRQSVSAKEGYEIDARKLTTLGAKKGGRSALPR